MKFLEFLNILNENYESSIQEFKKQGASDEDIVDYIKGGPKSFYLVHNNFSGTEKDIDWWSKQKDDKGKRNGWFLLKSFMDKKRSIPSKSVLKKTIGDMIDLIDNDTWNVIIPLSHESSCFYGKNTPWCIAKGNQPWFSRYFYDQRLIFVLFYNRITKRKWAIKFGNMLPNSYGDPVGYPEIEIFNQKNNVIDTNAFQIDTGFKLTDIIKLVKDIIPKIETQRKKNLKLDLFKLIDKEIDKRTFGKRIEELENLIIAKNSSYAAWKYVVDIVGKPIPELEKIIAKDASTAYYYASFINKRFPLGEPAIAKSAENSYAYAAEVLHKRFLEGEPAIAKASDYSFWYAVNVIKGRFKEGEPAILKAKTEIIPYIYKCLDKKPWPEGEDDIAENGSTAIVYALDILKKRFEKGERSIIKTAENFANGNTPYLSYEKFMNDIKLYMHMIGFDGTYEQWRDSIISNSESIVFSTEKDILEEGYKEAKEKFLKEYSSSDSVAVGKQIDDIFKSFRLLQNRIHGDEKNIDWWAKNKNLDELIRFVENIKNTPTKSSMKKEKGKYIVLRDDEDWFIIVPLSHEASCYYGSGTDWCTTKSNQPWFSTYNFKEGVVLIYFINKKTEKEPKTGKWAVALYTTKHEGMRQIFDKKDLEIDPLKFLKYTGLDLDEYINKVKDRLPEIIKKKEEIQKSDLYYLLKQAEETHEPNTDLENLIVAKKAVDSAWRYVKYVKESKPLKIFEPLFSSSPTYAINYAIYVIKGRFPEGEPAIAKEFKPAYEYALNILEGAFPLAEDLFASTPYNVYTYAHFILNKRFIKGEKTLFNDLTKKDDYGNSTISLLYNYYYYVYYKQENQRWPEAEKAILNTGNGDLLFLIVKNIIKGPWPEAEKYIAANYSKASYYLANILKTTRNYNDVIEWMRLKKNGNIA